MCTLVRYLVDLQHCLCCLVGQLNENGSINILDAFPNHVIVAEEPTAETEAVLLPEETHHDFVLHTRQRCYPRELVIGWASTDLSNEQLQAVSDWARAEPKASKFASQKKLSSPLLLVVSPPHDNQDLSVKCYTKGPITECMLKPLPIHLAAESLAKLSPLAGGNDSLVSRLDRAITLCDEAIVSYSARSTSMIRHSLMRAFIREQYVSAPWFVCIMLIYAASRMYSCPLQASKDELAYCEIGRQLHQAATIPLPAGYEEEQQQATAAFDYVYKLGVAQIELAEKLHALFA